MLVPRVVARVRAARHDEHGLLAAAVRAFAAEPRRLLDGPEALAGLRQRAVVLQGHMGQRAAEGVL